MYLFFIYDWSFNVPIDCRGYYIRYTCCVTPLTVDVTHVKNVKSTYLGVCSETL